MTTPKVSICIPYHQSEKTAFHLARLIKSIEQQTFKDFEIVLTDEGPFAQNHNAAIKKAKGEVVQMMQSDDYFASPDSLRNIVNGLTEGLHRAGSGGGWQPPVKTWQITACLHDDGNQVGNPHQPQWTDDIYTGNNRLGSVSTLSFRRDKALLFEEPLQWVVDCDLYYRLFLKYGYPHINTHEDIVINTKFGRLTDTITSIDKQNEVSYLLGKYAKG